MRTLGAILVLAASVAAGPARAAAADLAVIVHSGNAVDRLTTRELRESLLMERQHWRGGSRIYLILPETGTGEKELLLRRGLRMTEDQLRRHYLSKLYAGEIPAFPGTASSAAAARRLVARAPNAIAVIAGPTSDPAVKVVRIDGRRPEDEGYALADR
ncbi:MAG: hypothetical protein U0599_21820 [Vicinamibacteria bacterium]